MVKKLSADKSGLQFYTWTDIFKPAEPHNPWDASSISWTFRTTLDVATCKTIL